MVRRLRERLALLLVILLPLHALLVTAGTKLVTGKGHAPLIILAFWKEALLGVILVLALAEMIRALKAGGSVRRAACAVDMLDALILLLLLLAVVVTALTHRDWKLAAYGFKYDFIPLVSFLVLRRVAWSEAFQRAAVKALLGIGVVISLYGILTVFLPMRFFLWLGYAPAHSLYFADGPLAAFQQVSETALRRVQSTMSGPNQFGLWLLIPLGALLTSFSRERGSLVYWCIGVLVLGALFLTFSRAAWIAAFVMGLVMFSRSVPRSLRRKVTAGAVLIVITVAVAASLLFPSVFFRLSSSRGHLLRPLQAMERILEHPLGEGLGAAGPASNRLSETCVFLRPQDDPSWAKTTPRLCVFLGSTQVQPSDHVCRCPFLPENWYLQIGVEMGVIGFVLFIVLIVLVLRRLGMHNTQYTMHHKPPSKDHFPFVISHFVFLAFLGISIAALFLHAWEDAAVSYTVWLLLAIHLRSSRSLAA